MKRVKVTGGVAPVTVMNHEKEDKVDSSDNISVDDSPGRRMLENLNIALYFSRVQSKMGEQK